MSKASIKAAASAAAITALDTAPQMPAQGSAKAAVKAAEATSRDLWMIEPSRLRVVEGFNVRNTEDPAYQEHVRFIADSIKANGFYLDKPFAGFVSRGAEGEADYITITDGHTRKLALELAISEGAVIEKVPVVLKPQGTSVEDLTVALITSNAGRPLSPLEQASVVKRLVSFNLEVPEIAARLGRSTTHINDLLLLVGADPAVRKMVATGQVAASLAITEIKKHGDKATSRLGKAVDEALAGGKTRATKKTVKKAAAGATATAGAAPAASEILTVKRNGNGVIVLDSIQLVALERVLAAPTEEPTPDDVATLKPIVEALSKYLGTQTQAAGF